MKVLKSLIAFVIVIIIGFVVYLTVYKAEQAKKLREIEERRLIRFDLDQINSFQLVRPDSSIYFERGVGRIWNITAPVEGEADKKPIFQLFNTLHKSDILYDVDDNPENLDAYKLAIPEYYMAMNYDSGEKDTLFVGSNTPDGKLAYVRFATEDRVLAVSTYLTDLMKEPVRHYRSRTILNVMAEDIIGIEIDRKEGDEKRLVFDYNDMFWVMTYPWKNYPADRANMLVLFSEIEESYKRILVEEKTDDLSQYGLDDPSFIITLTLQLGMPTKMLLIGNQVPGKSSMFYAKQFDRDLIFVLEFSLIKALERNAIWLLDKQPARFNREIANRIVLETTGEPIEFYKDATENWNVVSPIDKNVLKESINLLYNISCFIVVNKIVAYEPEPGDYGEFGLDKPKITLSVYFNDSLLSKIFYGNSFMTDNPNTYIGINGIPAIFLTDAKINSNVNSVLKEVFSE